MEETRLEKVRDIDPVCVEYSITRILFILSFRGCHRPLQNLIQLVIRQTNHGISHISILKRGAFLIAFECVCLKSLTVLLPFPNTAK